MRSTIFTLFFLANISLCFSQTETNKAHPSAMLGFWSMTNDRPNNKLVLKKTPRKQSPYGILLYSNGSYQEIYPRKCGNFHKSIQKMFWHVDKETLNLVIGSVKYKIIKANDTRVFLSKIETTQFTN